jgi:hypothetical protein
MKTILSLRRHHYLKTVGIFLIAVVLIAGVVSCNGAATYELTMAADPAAGGTATDETNASPYAEGTVVDIKAVADPCYRFVDWTAPAGAIGNTTAAETTFTMPARDVTVTANFEPTPPDHFKFYEVDYETAPGVGKDVQLVDQFGAINATVGDAISFGNPVEKVHGDVPTPIADMNRHYTLYELLYEGEPQSWQVTVNNQFQDDVELTVWGPVALAVPTEKLEADLEAPVCLDHFLVYEVTYEEFPEVGVQLKDQFIEEDVTVWGPAYFANPVQKTIVDSGEVTEIQNPDEHLVFYSIEDIGFDESINKTIQIVNQFGEQSLYLTYRETLAVPTQKIAWEQPLDHFKSYWALWGEEPPMYEVPVQLEDQFVTIDAMVLDPYLFANPVNKEVSEVEWTPISDPRNHLTFYNIGYVGDPQVWEVTVNNQFGNDQVLYITGPLWLAVPTQKAGHDPPVGLDHFLVYDVIDYGQYPEMVVYLWDQFTEQYANVYYPEFFAIPAQKIHGDVLTPIKDDGHLVFYGITGGEFYTDDLPVVNQFGEQFLNVYQGEGDFLGVPSDKIGWDGPWPL